MVVHRVFFSGLNCGAFGVRNSIHCTTYHFSCVFGVIEPTNVAIRIYPFIHFYPRLVKISQQRVLAAPFALLAKVAYRIALLVCYCAKSDGLPVSSIWVAQASEGSNRSCSVACAVSPSLIAFCSHRYSDFIILV